MKRYHITPVPKPRMTRSDTWKKRGCVMRYWQFKDECSRIGISVPDCSKVTFIMPMPKSWSAKKRAVMNGQRHRQTPDLDNLMKSICDALYSNDSHISEMHAVKRWGQEAAIIVEPIALEDIYKRD